MSVFRTYAEIMALPDLSAAERELLENAPLGEWTVLGKMPPMEETNENRVRAGIIRYLVLGGCPDWRTHETGVRLQGAFVHDVLDLEGCDTPLDLSLWHCHISERLKLISARLGGLYLDNAACSQGILADRLRTLGGVHIRNGFYANSPVRLLGAQIGGDLDCCGGSFASKDNTEGAALLGDGLETKGNVFLRSVSPILQFAAKGSVRLIGARIGGTLECDGGRFEAVRLANEEQGTREILSGGPALSLDGAVIDGAIFWRYGAVAIGRIDLAGVSTGSLNDPDAAWPERLRLNGFRYGAITAGPTDAETRLSWLAKEDAPDGEFRPQPYEHLAKVLREMGHGDEARTVLIRKEVLQREAARRRLRVARSPRRFYAGARDWLLRYVVQYGHRPGFAFLWLLGFLLAGTIGFHLTWSNGGFAPASPVILTSAEWIDIERRVADNPAAFWADGPGKDYETFNALAYAFDVVVPVIDIGQESAWAPSASRNWWGFGAWIGRWALEIAGWIVAALGAAAITGIIRRE